VKLLAVSKTFPFADVETLARAGQIDFGENYVLEGVQKIDLAQAQASLKDLVWHCIGPIQSNKSKWVASHFAWAHALDRLKIAARLSEQRPEHLPPLNVLIQVNVDGGLTKSGVAPQEVLALAKGLMSLKGLKLRGIMTLPDPSPNEAAQAAVHQLGFEVFEDLKARLGLGAAEGLDTLSMGMTQDMEAAIQAGSTLVRVGTAIFGARTPKTDGI
jgi:pyridoxal phosphate enzyme (YggS family)